MNDAPPGPVRRVAALDRLMAAIVVMHFVTAGIHGAAHSGTGVGLTGAQIVFVGIVITAAPIYGLCLHMRRPGQAGAVILVVSMAASLVFGWVFHFVADTPDNIAHVEHAGGTWAVGFGSSAYAIAGLELIGALVAVALLRNARAAGVPRRRSRGPATP